MIAFRQAHAVLCKEAFYTDREIGWFNPEGTSPNWSDPKARQLGCLILGQEEPDLCLMFNAGDEALTFDLPAAPNSGHWYLAVDTSQPSPHDLFGAGEEMALENQKGYHVGARSGVILIAHGDV